MSLSFSCYSSDLQCRFAHMRWSCTSEVKKWRVASARKHMGSTFMPRWSALIKTKLTTQKAETALDKVSGRLCIINCLWWQQSQRNKSQPTTNGFDLKLGLGTESTRASCSSPPPKIGNPRDDVSLTAMMQVQPRSNLPSSSVYVSIILLSS